MELLLLLLAAHFVADFYLQSGDWIKCRNTHHIKSLGLWKHVSVHTTLNIIVFAILPFTVLEAAIAIALISVTHLLTDCWKSYQRNSVLYFLIDQLVHITIIVGVWLWLSKFSFDQVGMFLTDLISAKYLVIALAYILVGKPASILIALALKRHTDSLQNTLADSGGETEDASNDSVGLISAGAWIGYIERCLAISFVFMGQLTGIGFLVVTKTIFRFGDLTKSKDMKLTEYMMLGTLLSYAIALFVGWNALQLYDIF